MLAALWLRRFGFAAGWNSFLDEMALAIFDVTASNVIIRFWSDAMTSGGIVAISLMIYAFINLLAVGLYGEIKFWAAWGQIVLIAGLIFFTKCTRKGRPVYSVLVVLGITLLSCLRVRQNAAVVLHWFVSLVTASQLINFAVMSFTFRRLHRTLATQRIKRNSLIPKLATPVRSLVILLLLAAT